MKCPVDGAALVMSERQGIEIDYCPECRGVWLDRGELDKIVERSKMDGFSPTPPTQHQRHDSHHDGGHGHHKPHHRKRESWLGELFD